jgi:hypothetical protein
VVQRVAVRGIAVVVAVILVARDIIIRILYNNRKRIMRRRPP